MKKRKILETLADIAYIAGDKKYFSGDSRADINCFIYWANEFEKMNSKTDWDEVNYILAIEAFASAKIKSQEIINNF
jgi:hypothetical protein